MSAILYLEHLTDADLALLSEATGDLGSGGELQRYLHANPDYLEALLQAPPVFAALFGPGERDALLRASPFLVFAVLVHRVARDLTGARFVEEWVGPGRRIPMFEVQGLRAFAADALRRLFLAELLASYTHVASGSVWVQTPRGWRRRRFSELDPFRLIELLETLPEVERPAVYRRLGDLSLFLTGVFPDYAGRRIFPTSQRQRLQRALQWVEVGTSHALEPSDGFRLLEQLGSRSYQLAWRATELMGGGGASQVLGDMAEGFGDARRILNVLTDRYMFPVREQWFPLN